MTAEGAVPPTGRGWRAENPLIPELVALYRLATPDAKLAAVARLNANLLGLKEAQLAGEHPHWSDERRRAAVRRWWFGARD